MSLYYITLALLLAARLDAQTTNQPDHTLAWSESTCTYDGLNQNSQAYKNGHICCPTAIPRGQAGIVVADLGYYPPSYKSFSICGIGTASQICYRDRNPLQYPALHDTRGHRLMVCITPERRTDQVTININSYIYVPPTGLIFSATSRVGESQVCVTTQAGFRYEATIGGWATNAQNAVIKPKKLSICETGPHPMPDCIVAPRGYRNVKATQFRYLSQQKVCAELYDAKSPITVHMKVTMP